MSSQPIERHRTALARHDLSRPVRLAVGDSLIGVGTKVFDYGCGRGDDIRALRRAGIECEGWDPAHRPDAPKRKAHTVNLGYVVNVIENAQERADTLKEAWSLAGRLLIVSAQLRGDARSGRLRPHGDGFLTLSSTFQKYWDQGELRAWIDETLETASVAAAPGVFYAFRDQAQREAFVASRFQRRSAAPRVRQSDLLFQENEDSLRALMDFFAERGRLPSGGELDASPELERVFGTVKKAFLVVRRVTGPQRWQQIQQERREDLLVYLALARFRRRPSFTALPQALQHDIRALFRGYKDAAGTADTLLFSLAHQVLIDAACRESTVGKLMPTALYVHDSALGHVPILLRVYEGAARAYVGDVEDTNVIKLNREEARVSYLAYPRFESDPHPALAISLTVSLARLRIRERQYRNAQNPPILHKKEELVASDYALRAKFARLTAQETRWGLYEAPDQIGTQAGWDAKLRERGLELRGHRVVRIRRSSA